MALGIPNIITGDAFEGSGGTTSRAQNIKTGSDHDADLPPSSWSAHPDSCAQNIKTGSGSDISLGLSQNPTQGSSSAGSLPPDVINRPPILDQPSNVESDAAADSSGGIGSDVDYSTPYNFGEYLSGLFASVGAENEINRTFNAYQAQANRDFQERMSNSAYTRAVRDLMNAGLNPVLAFSSAGSAASTPSGSQAYLNVSGGDTFSSVLSSLANAASVIGQLLSFFGVGKNTVGSIGFK